MYQDLLKVDLSLHRMRSNKRLVSFAAITVSLTHPGMYLKIVFQSNKLTNASLSDLINKSGDPSSCNPFRYSKTK